MGGGRRMPAGRAPTLPLMTVRLTVPCWRMVPSSRPTRIKEDAWVQYRATSVTLTSELAAADEFTGLPEVSRASEAIAAAAGEPLGTGAVVPASGMRRLEERKLNPQASAVRMSDQIHQDCLKGQPLVSGSYACPNHCPLWEKLRVQGSESISKKQPIRSPAE
ncbi:MAG: hypothetical protein FRX49_12464 [Trebouxia sp. A1-2]|nr:MAG: hypothetical protein FRX49_12464 [Trebouxia sp. A1-2]